LNKKRVVRKKSARSKNVGFGRIRPKILSAVTEMYTEVATNPSKGFHFPSGRDAALYIGYNESELSSIPETAYESFAGVGKPFDAGEIRAGEVVLDVGSGAGTDTLLAAKMVGSTGRVIALDMTEAMLDKLKMNVEKAGTSNVQFLKGSAEKIELPDGSVDVVISNGVINLVPNKKAVFRELYRVLKPGGRIQIADIVLHKDIPLQSRMNPQLWAECIVGAELERDYLSKIRDAGLVKPRLVKRIDYFARSANANTKEVAAYYKAESILINATKPM